MKRFNILLVFFVLSFGCLAQENQKESSVDGTQYKVFGEEFNGSGYVSTEKMTEKYNGMNAADSLQVKMKATVTDVCRVKGCWMKLQLQDGNETMVRFKDYGFFMPFDVVGKEVIVNGIAFVEAMSVDDQKHYAKDAGMSEAEIAKIKEPKKIFGFEADGVLMSK